MPYPWFTMISICLPVHKNVNILLCEDYIGAVLCRRKNERSHQSIVSAYYRLGYNLQRKMLFKREVLVELTVKCWETRTDILLAEVWKKKMRSSPRPLHRWVGELWSEGQAAHYQAAGSLSTAASSWLPHLYSSCPGCLFPLSSSH